MVRNEFTFPSADGRTGIHAVEWTPDMALRAVLVLSHGVSEHILRYEPLAAYLTERGFAVAGHDHLGHGLSVAAGAPRLYFGPRGSWDWAVQDLYARRELAGQRFPGLPVFLLGHSMGSFLARTYLIRYPGTVAGAILMGTGQMPPALVAAGTHWEKQPTYGLTQTGQYSVDADGHVWVVLNRSDLADRDPAALLEDLGATLYAFEP